MQNNDSASHPNTFHNLSNDKEHQFTLNVTATNAKGLIPENDFGLPPKHNLTPEQELNARRILAGMSPIELLFYAARVNPKSRFNRHHNTYNYAMGRHIAARRQRAYHKARKAQLKVKSR